VDEQGAWAEVGNRIREAREAARPELSMRGAAQKAGFSDATWRKIEAGGLTQHGHWTPPNPTNANLEAAAIVVGLDPQPLFELVGRTYQGPYNVLVEGPGDREALERLRSQIANRARESRAALSGKIARLSDDDAAAVEAIIDRLLGEGP
jgi:transcriptional regulator with XRE-family HTH domain